MLGTQITILGGIIEYGFLLAITKYGKELKNAVQSLNNGKLEQPEKQLKKSDENLAKKIDTFAFSGSILFMILFNITYWTVVYFL